MNAGLPGYCNKGIPGPRVLFYCLPEVAEVPGKGMGILHLAELTEVAGTGTEVLQSSQKFWVLWHGRIELTKVPGRSYKDNVPVPRVWFCTYPTEHNLGVMHDHLFPLHILLLLVLRPTNKMLPGRSYTYSQPHICTLTEFHTYQILSPLNED